MNAALHRPVLLREVLAVLAPKDGGRYVDGTFGAGGYSAALLGAADCRVWAIDRDPDAIAGGAELVQRHSGRLTLLHGRFGEMASLLAAAAVPAVDGVALDLGISSMQLDRPERGFSFRADGPLDMRMGKHGTSAADLVNALPEAELAAILRDLGEERFARRVAGAIVRARPLADTAALANAVRAVIPARHDAIDPATRTFQALRIAVNDELGELDRGLAAAERLLAPGGRLAVVTFHSLEDRPVKNFLRTRSGTAPSGSRHLPPTVARAAPTFRLIAGYPVTPAADELAANPRARSAKLRAAERTAAPPWPLEVAA